MLNCNTYDVGLHAAVELGADKLFCLHLSGVDELKLPPWLPLSDARTMLLNRMMGHVSIAVSLRARKGATCALCKCAMGRLSFCDDKQEQGLSLVVAPA